MAAYWLKFPTKQAGCVEADSQDRAHAIGKEKVGEAPTSCEVLPYPADPRLNKAEHSWGFTPSFCFEPNRCAGRTSCPRDYSCVD